MFKIKDDEILSVVYRYCLARDEGHIYIEIFKHVAGRFKKKFIAIPIRDSHWVKEYSASANTKEEALNKCLTLLKEASVKDFQ